MSELVMTIKSEHYHTRDADREDGDTTDEFQQPWRLTTAGC